MQVTTFAVRERGDREYNDDAYGDADLAAGRCLVVADGAGGHRGGAIAARIVTETVMLTLAATPKFDGPALVAAVDAASRQVHRRQAEPGLSEMSATVVLLCLDVADHVAHWIHLGDSRLYHFHRGIAEQLTTDHSVLQSFIDAGIDFGGGANAGPHRSVLYAAVGAEGETRPVPYATHDLQDGDAFLLCSDGVWDSVAVAEMERLLLLAGNVQEWVEGIGEAVRRAQRANQDNYTALGLWLGSPEQITVIRV